jgi:hypothetical protein
MVAAADIVAVVLLVTAVTVVPAGMPVPITTSPMSPALMLLPGSVSVVEPLVMDAAGIVRLIGRTGLIVTTALADEEVAAFERVTLVPLMAVIVVPFGIPAP